MGHAFWGQQAFKQIIVSYRAQELHQEAVSYLKEPSTYMRFLTGK